MFQIMVFWYTGMYQCTGVTHLLTCTWHHIAEEQWLVRHIHYGQFRIWMPTDSSQCPPACGGAVQGPWTCRATRQWDHRQACKGRLCSKVCRTWASLFESLGRIYKEGLEIGWLTSIGYGGEVLGDTQRQAW